MGNPNHSDHIAEAAERADGLGVRLRRAREARRLSITTAAASLNLSPRVIEALEENDFKQFKPVYVRGYLRNYARLLELKADPLIESYNQTLPPEHPAAHAHELLTANPPARRSGYLVLAAVGLPLLLWLASKAPQILEEWHMPLGEAASSALSAKPLEEVVSAPTPPSSGETANPSPEPSAPSVNAPVAPVVPPANPVNADPPVAMGPPVSAEPATPPTESAGKTIQPIGQGPDSIAIRLSATAWVSIRDPSGRRLVHESIPAGTERTYQGQAPFTVVLGNSPATQIVFNGQPYAPPKPKGGTVARFTLGKPNSKTNP